MQPWSVSYPDRGVQRTTSHLCAAVPPFLCETKRIRAAVEGPMVNRKAGLLPWIALGAVYILWGSTYLGIRVAVATIPPFLMAGSRYVVAGLLMLSLQWCLSKEKPSLPGPGLLGRIALSAVLLIVIGNGILCMAETRVEAGTAALLVTSTPIWMLLFSAWRPRKMPGWTAIAGVVLGSAGMVVLIGKNTAHADALFSGLILVGSASWALGSIFARDREHHPLTASLEMTIGGAGLTLAGFAFGEASHLDLAAVTAQSWWGWLWLVTGGAMLGYTAYAYTLRTLPTATVATYAYVNPVVAVTLGALLLGERITWNVLAGGVAIVVSVALILIGSRTEAHPEELPDEAIA